MSDEYIYEENGDEQEYEYLEAGVEDEEEDDLSDLDEETRARFENYASRQEKLLNETLSRYRDGLRSIGLDFGPDPGQISISDLNTASKYFSGLFREPNVETENAQVKDDVAEEWVDPSIDPDAFERRLEKAVKQVTKKYEEEINNLRNTIIQDRMEQAIHSIPDAVAKYAPAYREYLDHPQFEELFKGVLANTQMEQWQDPKNLVRLVGLIIPDLPLQEQAKVKAKANSNTSDSARSVVNRTILRQAAPSKSSTVPRGVEFSDDDRELARRLGITVEEAWALGQDTTGTEYRRVKSSVGRRR